MTFADIGGYAMNINSPPTAGHDLWRGDHLPLGRQPWVRIPPTFPRERQRLPRPRPSPSPMVAGEFLDLFGLNQEWSPFRQRNDRNHRSLANPDRRWRQPFDRLFGISVTTSRTTAIGGTDRHWRPGYGDTNISLVKNGVGTLNPAGQTNTGHDHHQ